jgi:hypothetical protein
MEHLERRKMTVSHEEDVDPEERCFIARRRKRLSLSTLSQQGAVSPSGRSECGTQRIDIQQGLE